MLKQVAAQAPEVMEQQSIGGNLGVANVARWVEFARDPEADGPTDEKLTNELLNADLDTIYKTWDEAVLKNLQENHPKDLKDKEKADALALKDFAALQANMEE